MTGAELGGLKNPWDDLAPLGKEFAGRFDFNLDGAPVTQARMVAEPRENYLQVFRHGALESASIEAFLDEEGYRDLHGQSLEDQVRSAAKRFLALEARMEIGPPFVIGLSLLGVLGYHMHVGNHLERRRFPTQPFDRDDLVLPEIWVESADSNVSELLADSFDVIWNAAGQAGSPFR